MSCCFLRKALFLVDLRSTPSKTNGWNPKITPLKGTSSCKPPCFGPKLLFFFRGLWNKRNSFLDHLKTPNAKETTYLQTTLNPPTWNQNGSPEPHTTIYKWLFQLDDSKSLYRKWLEITKHPLKNGWPWGSTGS